jgi:hypothetical protein
MIFWMDMMMYGQHMHEHDIGIDQRFTIFTRILHYIEFCINFASVYCLFALAVQQGPSLDPKGFLEKVTGFIAWVAFKEVGILGPHWCHVVVKDDK